jgi:hypothetical protein
MQFRCLACGHTCPRVGTEWIYLSAANGTLGPFCSTRPCAEAGGTWTEEECLRRVFGDAEHAHYLETLIETGRVKG